MARGGIGVTIPGGIEMGRTEGEDNDNEETDDKEEGVDDDKEDYNTTVAMVTIVTTITTTLVLAYMSYYVGSNRGPSYSSIIILLALHMIL